MDNYGQQSNGAYTPDSYAYSPSAPTAARPPQLPQPGAATPCAVDEMDLRRTGATGGPAPSAAPRSATSTCTTC